MDQELKLFPGDYDRGVMMKQKIFSRRSCAFLIVALLLFELVVGLFGIRASAATSEGDVLAELTRDPSFTTADYSAVSDDYSLQVMQIGESESGNLYIYVYQPSDATKELVASSVNIYYGFSHNGEGMVPTNYELELVSSSGVFDKYLVKDFSVRSDLDRYYNIVSIYRPFDASIDEPASTGTTKTEMVYPVGQQWYAHWLNGEILYEMNTFKTYQIPRQFVGSVRLSHGLTWGSLIGNLEKCDAWYLAFNEDPNYDIDKIIEANLSFDKSYYRMDPVAGSAYDSKVRVNNQLLSNTDEMSFAGKGIGGVSVNWNRIMTSQEFVQTVEKQNGAFGTEERKELLTYDFVFAFCETEYAFNPLGVIANQESYYVVENVSLLRIRFLDTTGKTYDLSVVSDKVSGDNVPEGEVKGIEGLLEEIMEYLGLLLLIVVLGFLWNPVSFVLKILWLVIKVVFHFLLWLLSIPIKIFGFFFRRRE